LLKYKILNKKKMAKFITDKIDFTSITSENYPQVGSFIFGFDMSDDIFKKMDSNGVVTIIGGTSGSTDNLWSAGTGTNSVVLVNSTNVANGNYATAEGSGTTASGITSHAEGSDTIAEGNYSHAEGLNTSASGLASHAEGWKTTTFGTYGHAEGNGTTTFGEASHAEGQLTIASGNTSHAEGTNTIASGDYSHAEGSSTLASGVYSHAEGHQSTALGNYSHAGGRTSIASGSTSFVHGFNSVAGGVNTIVLGNNITGNVDNTTYVNSLNIGTVNSGITTTILAVDSNGYVISGTSINKYATSLVAPTGGATNTITHNLGTTDISVSLWLESTGDLTSARITNRTTNSVDVIFSVSPSENVRVVILG